MDKWYFIFKIIGLCGWLVAGGMPAGVQAQQAEAFPKGICRWVVLPANEESRSDRKWATYLLGQAQRRLGNRATVTEHRTGNVGEWTVYTHLDAQLKGDYALQTERQSVRLTAPDDDTMRWLVYQWMSRMGETDSRWQTDDLEPALPSLGTGIRKFDFGYRSIYSSPMSDPDYLALTASRHVDYHWGLWGHNLPKVFGGKIPADAQALIAGTRTEQQLCFSSETLLRTLTDFIIDAYGHGEKDGGAWFAILPNDNALVCQCPRCRQLGNTPHNATPAVTYCLKQLARQFPKHQFYTAAYATTLLPPTEKLPANTGVLLSAIDLPLTSSSPSGAAAQRWLQTLQQWKQATTHLIVWDYMRNFDDYFTPFPALKAIQKRLQWLRSNGVWGLFFNGSGDDYATFDELQTYVLSTLLKDTETEVDTCVRRYLKRFYPVCGTEIANYYLALEDKAAQMQVPLEWYAGIDFATRHYLDAAKFQDFCVRLNRLSKTAGEEERGRLNRLLTALNFTQLELIRSGKGKEAEEWLELLKGYTAFPNMYRYKEAHGLLADYIAEWEHYPRKPASPDNRMKTVRIREVATDGKVLADRESLKDGYYGFPHDYHLHWYIIPRKEVCWEITGLPPADGTLVLSFLHTPVWRIGVPARIEVWQGETQIGLWTHAGEDEAFSIREIHLPIHYTTPSGKLSPPLCIKIYGSSLPQMACDEIEWHDNK